MNLIVRAAMTLNEVVLAPFGVRVIRASTLDQLIQSARPDELVPSAPPAQAVQALPAEPPECRLPERGAQDPLGTWVLAEFEDGRRLWVDLGDEGVSRPCLTGTFEPAETGFVRSVLKPGQSFIDIGANIGWFTILAARIVGPAGHVTAFEPRPTTGGRLRMSVAENGFRHVDVRLVALGAASGRMTVATLIAARNPGGTWLLATSFLEGAWHKGYERFEVDVVRLDDVAPARCDLLKIDIEGAEYLALSGGAGTIRRLRPIIICEINPQALRKVSELSAAELVRFVEAWGYRAHAIQADGPGPALPDGFAASLTEVVNVAFLPA